MDREFVQQMTLFWGLVPSPKLLEKLKAATFNARAETVAEEHATVIFNWVSPC